eukprot:PhF_6_TR24024/c0_g1_i1/m.33641
MDFLLNGDVAQLSGDITATNPTTAMTFPSSEAYIPAVLPTSSSAVELSSAKLGMDPEVIAQRPWRQPNAKMDDYFNYGFNEWSWAQFVAMQVGGPKSVLSEAEAQLHMEGYDVSILPSHIGAKAFFSPTAANQVVTQMAKPVKMCKQFLESGSCKFGINCYYSHGDGSMNKRPRSPPRSNF